MDLTIHYLSDMKCKRFRQPNIAVSMSGYSRVGGFQIRGPSKLDVRDVGAKLLKPMELSS